jgi:hypothetical protein
LPLHKLDPVAAVRRIETDRSDVFAIDVVGRVSAADAENLFGLLEGAYALHDRLDLLVRIMDFDGVDWSDVSRETIETGREHALAHVRRCAAVGGPDWTASLTGFFSPSLPVELRHFPIEEEAEAWAWIGARPVEDSV